MFSITIYLDLLFLLNWGMNWWLLWATGVVARCPVKTKVISLAAALGGLCSFLWLLVPVTLAYEVVFKAVVALGMLQLCFVPQRLGGLIKLALVFTLLSALTAGTTYALALSGTSKTGEALPRIGWYVVVGGPLLLTLPLKSLWSTVSHYFRRSSDAVPLRFSLRGTRVQLDAILDTGNTLLEPLTYRPVIVVDFRAIADQLPQEVGISVAAFYEGGVGGVDNLPDTYLDRISLIPFDTAAGHGLMLSLRPENCELWAKGTWHRVDAVIGLSPGEVRLAGKSALLPYTVWPVENL